MPNEMAHLASANRTQLTIGHLLVDREIHSPWIATCAFYKALHIVEAVFANDRSVGHTATHDQREDTLRRTRKYEMLYRNYAPLKRASLNARYLANMDNFDDFLSPQVVVEKLLKHYLAQVERSARKFLTPASNLASIGELFAVSG